MEVRTFHGECPIIKDSDNPMVEWSLTFTPDVARHSVVGSVTACGSHRNLVENWIELKRRAAGTPPSGEAVRRDESLTWSIIKRIYTYK